LQALQALQDPPEADARTEDVLNAQRASLQRALKDIDTAFARLDDGTYGICGSCARPIPVERLEILPYARCCVPCQQRAG